MVTRAPMATRLLFVPTSLKRTRWNPLAFSFSRSDGGSPALSNRTSMLPLLETSPKAAPARVKRKCGKARFLADLVKSAVAIVAMEEQRLLEAGTGVQRIDLRIDMAIGDENVEPGIVVHVKE